MPVPLPPPIPLTTGFSARQGMPLLWLTLRILPFELSTGSGGPGAESFSKRLFSLNLCTCDQKYRGQSARKWRVPDIGSSNPSR